MDPDRDAKDAASILALKAAAVAALQKRIGK
jgi:hypothetical protein